ncbi:MAG TPA: hypothetical protein VGQ91_14825, partial [Ideonella sp.]|nr:hypothetical protein [Ideonella sp.]
MKILCCALLAAALAVWSSPIAAKPGFAEVTRALGPVQVVTLGAGHLYAGVDRRLQVYRLGDNEAPKLVYEGASEADDIADLRVRDGRLYVAAGKSGLRIYDLAVAGRPALLGSLALPGFKPRGLATDGSMLYAASAAAGIHVIDVSVPSAPALITVFSEADASYVALNLRAPYLYVADGQRHLLVLDVTEPAAPQRVGRATLPANGQQIALRG